MGKKPEKAARHRLGGTVESLGETGRRGGARTAGLECGLTALSPGYHELLKGFKEWSKEADVSGWRGTLQKAGAWLAGLAW